MVAKTDCIRLSDHKGQIACDDEGKHMIADLFDDLTFELARRKALDNASMLWRMGEFEPTRLGPEEMEYATLGQILGKLEERFMPA